MSEGLINHFGAVRMRVTGSGTLRSTLYSLDSINSVALANITLSATTNKEPTLLANFSEARAQLEITTTAIDENFEISKIVIFLKPVATGLPT